jgi:Na+-transporting NADH:ubiquinone oxidoreductase subunit NqrF
MFEMLKIRKAQDLKRECNVKMEEMTIKTNSMEKVIEKLSEEGKVIPECCICVNVQDLLVFAPCGHQIVCQNCFKKMKKMECPMCRTEIKSFCKIFT